MTSKEWDEKNAWAKAYLDEHRFMTIEVETDYGKFETEFYYDSDILSGEMYTASIHEKHVVVQGTSVRHCIEELNMGLKVMKEYEDSLIEK